MFEQYRLLAGYLLSDIAAAIEPVPNPSSLEKIPFCIPINRVSIVPVPNAFILRALFIISIKIWGIKLLFLSII